jgi:putative phosphoesterase
MRMRIGLVADTHGRLDPALAVLFAGCDLIVHAGDVDTAPVLRGLGCIAPVRAARGNGDDGPFGASLPESLRLSLGGVHALVIHEGRADAPSPALRRLLREAPTDLVIHGHSHHPGSAWHGSTLFVNPGSAGPRRFALPCTASVLTVEGRRVEIRWYDLAAGAPSERPPRLVADLDAAPGGASR